MPSRSQGEVQLIVNADDFGQSDETVSATIECFEAGALTSATLTAGMPATERALEFALTRPEFGYGVHLTFDRDPVERPTCDPALVRSLVDDDGRLLPTRTIRERALLGRLDPREIAREAEAQIQVLLERGLPVSHVDSHRHLHKLAPFRTALAAVLPRLGLRRVRAAQDIYLRKRASSATYWLGRRWDAAVRKSFETTDHFFMPRREDPPWSEALLVRLRTLSGASLEVGVHPGRDEPWRDRDRREALTLARALPPDVALVDWRTL